MVSQKVIVINKHGFHLKPAGAFCTEAMKYQSKVTFQFGTTNANAKSVLGVLAAGVKEGDEIEIQCDGADEELALTNLVNLVSQGFGLEE